MPTENVSGSEEKMFGGERQARLSTDWRRDLREGTKQVE